MATINSRWEATQRVMAAELTRLTLSIAIHLHVVAESYTICSSRSRRPVRKLLDTPSFFRASYAINHRYECIISKASPKLKVFLISKDPVLNFPQGRTLECEGVRISRCEDEPLVCISKATQDSFGWHKWETESYQHSVLLIQWHDKNDF
jgi:hypothetical protein